MFKLLNASLLGVSTFLLTLCAVGPIPAQARSVPAKSYTAVFVPVEDRVLNTDGNCGYCSFEMACRYHGIRRGYGLAARNPASGIGGHKGCLALIKKLRLKHRYIYDKRNTDFLYYWTIHKKHPVIVAGQNHIVLVVHYNPPVIKIIDNTGKYAKKVHVWSEEKFKKWWNGRAYVVLADSK